MRTDVTHLTPLSTGKRMKLFLPTIFFGICMAIAVTLGFWQLQRLEWKRGLIKNLQEKAQLLPQPLPLSLNEKEHLFLKVKAKGEFLNDKELYLYSVLTSETKGTSGQGFLVFTPFKLNNGEIILVNRGFVTKENKLNSVKLKDEQEITGVIRFNEKPNAFSAKDDAKANVFYTRNSENMLSSQGLKGNAAFIDLTQSPVEKPLIGAIKPSLPNNHLDYALTWFGLALTMLGVYLVLMFKIIRGKQ